MLSIVKKVINLVEKTKDSSLGPHFEDGSLLEECPQIQDVRVRGVPNDTYEIKTHGKIAVRDNEIIVTDPVGTGSYATLKVPDDPRIQIEIDGEVMHGRVVVHSHSEIRVVTLKQTASFKKRIEESSNMLTVSIQIDITPGELYFLKNVDETGNASLEIGMYQTYPVLPTEQELISELTHLGYKGELDYEALFELTHTKKTLERVVIRGKAPILPKPPRCQLVELPAMHDPFRGEMETSTVTIGTTVAVLKPGIPGVPGTNVFGEELEAPEARPLPKLGTGVIEVNGRIVAIRDGRLIHTNKRLDVVPELIVEHDVEPKDGKIEFNGNVIVRGKIHDGSFIKATGKVVIYGAAFNSTIIGKQGIFIKEAVVGGKLIAGQSEFLYEQLKPKARSCLNKFSKFRDEYSQTILQAQRRLQGYTRIPMIANVLMIKRHQDLDNELKSFYSTLTSLTEDDHHVDIANELQTKWQGVSRTNICQADVYRLYDLLSEYVEYLESVDYSGRANIVTLSLTSCLVVASGKIEVMGAGVYSCTLESKDTIIVKKAVRGGFLTANKAIDVYELGTSSGIECSIKVLSPAGQVYVQIRHPNTLIELNGRRDRNLITQHNVTHAKLRSLRASS